jgi:hypothetical protein
MCCLGLQFNIYLSFFNYLFRLFEETERQRDTKTKRQKDKETDRQRDRKTKRQKDKETERQRDRKTKRQKDKETERQRDRQTKIDRKTKKTDRHICLNKKAYQHKWTIRQWQTKL